MTAQERQREVFHRMIRDVRDDEESKSSVSRSDGLRTESYMRLVAFEGVLKRVRRFGDLEVSVRRDAGRLNFWSGLFSIV